MCPFLRIMKKLMEIVRKLVQRIQTSGFLKSVLTLSSGVIVGQAINFLGMPVVGRVYTPTAMGDYTLITANSAIISAFVCLGMMTTFLLPKENEEARGLTKLVTASTVLLTTVVIGVLWACSGVFQIFHTEEVSYGVSLMVLWLYIVTSTISNICYAYVNRQKLYRVMFWNPIITAVINVVVGVVLGLLGWGFLGYTAAHILSYLVNILHLAIHANPFAKVTNPEYRGIALLKSYRRFPLYQMPANLIANMSSQLPVNMSEALYSATELGLYSMAMRILALPSTLLATPINRVFFQEASERYNRGENIGDFCYKILSTNIKIAVIPISILILFGEPIFAIFLGEQWKEAGFYAAIMGVYQMMLFCASCLSGHFVIIKKSHWNLISAIAGLVLCVSLFFFCKFVATISIVEYLALLSLLMTVKLIAEQSALFVHLKFSLVKYLLLILKWVVLPCGISLAITWLLRAQL